MKFYVLTRKEEPGCPLGMLSGILHSHFFLNAHKSNYGDQPWYSNPSSGRPHEPFPDGLSFVTTDKSYAFDIRSDSEFFYLASDAFITLCDQLVVRVEDKKPVDVLSRQGKPVSGKKYWVCRFHPVAVPDAIDSGHSILEPEEGSHQMRIRKLRIRDDFKQDLFKLSPLAVDIDTLFCSERFREAAQRLSFRGITFTDIEAFNWPPKRTAAELIMATMFDKTLPHPI
jgi:hypothetical protein